MKTNRSPLNQQDQDSHEFDHKPAKSEIEKANFINNKLKKMRKKRLNYELGTKELDAMETGTSKNVVEDVVVNAPKNYSQIKNRDGSQLMTANEAKITDETGFKPDSVKDKEFRGGPNRKSALNMLGISRKSSPLDCWTDYERVPGTKEFSKGSCRKK